MEPLNQYYTQAGQKSSCLIMPSQLKKFHIKAEEKFFRPASHINCPLYRFFINGLCINYSNSNNALENRYCNE